MTVNSKKIQSLGSFSWSIAEILRGDFKQSEYGKVVLPFVVLRRLDCILEASKDDVLKAAKNLPKGIDEHTQDMILFNAVGGGLKVYNLSKFTFKTLHGQDPTDIHKNLIDYITKFNANVRDIFLDKFLFTDQLKRLKDAGILWQVFESFAQIDLHPKQVSNIEMGYLFEDLIRRFSEVSNETAGEHFTPREVIHLIVDLLLVNDADALAGSGVIRTVYDPACGTGGMLAIAEEEMKKLNSKIRVELFGQELNGESFGICKSDMLVTGHNPDQIAFGNTLIDDAHKDRKFHYILSNPPYGVDWKKYKNSIETEAKSMGFNGRFGAGLPRVSDGQLLFLMHMISKMRDDEIGSRIGIVMNGSPLFTGGAGSGESEIRRWIIENDWLETIVALPTDLFYNTEIKTYVWILTNRKVKGRRDKIQLIDASGEHFWQLMRKKLGKKRREISETARHEIVKIYHEQLNGGFGLGEFSKMFDKTDFGYREICVERPLKLNFQCSEERLTALKKDKYFLKLTKVEQNELIKLLSVAPLKIQFKNRNNFEKVLQKALKNISFKFTAPLKKAIFNALAEKDERADICIDINGNPESDAELRDTELVPLKEKWQTYFEREIKPFSAEAWIDESNIDAVHGKIGYEINFDRYFYRETLLRPIEEGNNELTKLEAEISFLLKEIKICVMRTNKLISESLKKSSTKHARFGYIAKRINRQVIVQSTEIYIPIGLYNKGRGIFHKEKTLGSALGDSTFTWIEENDLIFSGQFAWEGAVALAGRGDDGKIASHRYPIYQGIDGVKTAYLFSYFRTHRGNFIMDDCSRGAAGRNRPLNTNRLEKELIPVPSLTTQEAIEELVKYEARLKRKILKVTKLVNEIFLSLVTSAVSDQTNTKK